MHINSKHFKPLSLVFVALFAILLTSCGTIGNLPKGEFVAAYDSPNSNFTIDIYLCNGGATTDFAIRGELIDNLNDKKRIFIGVITKIKRMSIGLMKKMLL